MKQLEQNDIINQENLQKNRVFSAQSRSKQSDAPYFDKFAALKETDEEEEEQDETPDGTLRDKINVKSTNDINYRRP